MKIRPLADKILVERLDAETTTAGGIVLPDSAQEKPAKGRIVAVGDGRIMDDGSQQKLQVAKGDVVLFASYAGTDIKVSGKEYMIMTESDVMAVVEG